MDRCPACATVGGREFAAREMMFGTREEFEYIECPKCRCLYISRLPGDLDQHYPVGYYSLSPPADHTLIRAIKRARGRHAMGAHSLIGAIAGRILGPPDYAAWVEAAGVGLDSAILDVGAGGGHRVFNMTEAGFTNVSGVEPYLKTSEVDVGNGAIVRRAMPEPGSQAFDLVMMHHSFEHVPDPIATLQSARALLRANGCLLLRLPIAGTYAWRNYRTNWVQLDPPRHLILHTEASLAALAARTGFVIESSFYDSVAMQFWGSEMYAANVPLVDRQEYLRTQGYRRGRPKLLRLDRAARRLNQARDGDQGAFFLRPEQPS